MADSIRLVDYFYVTTSHKPGEGARVLRALQGAGVNLLAFSGFPSGRRAQLDFVPADGARFKAVAKREKWKVTGPKRAFLIEGEDHSGAVADCLATLAGAKINVTAMDALCAGAGRYGAILWVASKDVGRAAKLLGSS